MEVDIKKEKPEGGRTNLVFAAHHELGVVDDVEAEDEGTGRPVTDHCPLVLYIFIY